MKKNVCIITTALLLLGALAKLSYAQLNSVDNDSISITITFVRGMPGSIALYDRETGGSLVTSINLDNTLSAPQDRAVVIGECWLEITPGGFYEVHMYTNNLDPENDGLIPDEIDQGAVAQVPHDFNYWEPQRQSLWIEQWAGLVHEISQLPYHGGSEARMYMLPLKVRSEGMMGFKANELSSYENEATTITEIEGDGVTIPRDIFFGRHDYHGYQCEFIPFYYIPERSAVTYEGFEHRLSIASTNLGTYYPRRQQLIFAVDLLHAGPGTYRGTVYLEMMSN